jgi:hypothetical protein
MSKERARRRAEREAEAVRLETVRAAKAAREAGRQRRSARLRAKLRPLLPNPSRPDGPLARRRRVQNRAVFALFLAVQGAAWLIGLSGTARFGVFALSLLITPVVVVMAFDRRS